MRHRLLLFLPFVALIPAELTTRLDEVVPNDNRLAAGSMANGVLTVRLEARLAAWRPDLGVDSTTTVQVFAEEGGAPQIPGPLIRAAEGTEILVSLRNRLDSAVVVHGLRGGEFSTDTLQVGPQTQREVRFRASAPGTYFYWGTTTGSRLNDRPWRDSQLTGALVIDPRGVPPDSAERIFVITVLDVYLGDTLRNRKKEDIWELAINGRSWPHTERFTYPVGKPIRWRWINGSYLPHPMHLHGFHYRVTARGENNRHAVLAPDSQPTVVTEFMMAGGTYAMEWTPTRAGTWLFHCHMIPHITPFPERPDSIHTQEMHDLARHPMSAMSGLVLGVTSSDDAPSDRATVASPAPLRLFAQQARSDSGKRLRANGFVLQRGAEPRPDSVDVPGTPLVLTRGETASITVINRLSRPTTVHWHGMELESVFDGVSGWSRSGTAMAPLVAPGDSFTVTFTPPRAGTFIYHTHIDEGPQLPSGMYGPMLVLEPGERWTPETDLTFMFGTAVVNDSVVLAVNGRREHQTRELALGTAYRLRLINIHPADPARMTMTADSVPLAWRPIAKDGAALPPALRAEGPSRLPRIGSGETYDFAFTPRQRGGITLLVETLGGSLRVPFVVR